jgi:hypothetical protein
MKKIWGLPTNLKGRGVQVNQAKFIDETRPSFTNWIDVKRPSFPNWMKKGSGGPGQ